MKGPSSLYKLIKKLNSKESTYIKKYLYKMEGNQEKKILELLDLYKKLKSYDSKVEILVLKRIFQSQNIAASRNYVFNKIIECLSFYYSEKDETIKLFEELKQFLVLKKKGLTAEAIREISKLHKKIDKGEIKSSRYFILSGHLNMLTSDLENHMDELLELTAKIEMEGKLIQENARSAELFFKSVKLRSQINSFSNSDLARAEVLSLLGHPFLNQETYLSNFGRSIAYRTKSQLNLLIGNVDQSIHTLKDYLDNNADFTDPKSELNIGIDLFSLIQLFYWVGDVNSFVQYYEIFKSHLANVSASYQKDTLDAHSITIESFKINLLKETGIPVEKLITKGEKIDIDRHADQYLNFFINIALKYLNQKSFDKALEIINQKIYSHSDWKLFKIYYFKGMLIENICFFELEMDSNLDSRLRSFYRLLKKEESLSSVLKIIINCIKQLNLNLYQSDASKCEVLTDHYDQIQSLVSQSQLDKSILDSFQLLPWMEKKIVELRKDKT